MQGIVPPLSRAVFVILGALVSSWWFLKTHHKVTKTQRITKILYLIHREEGEAAARQALRKMDTFAVEWLPCGQKILETAAALKSRGRLGR